MALVVAFFISISALLQARRDIVDPNPVARVGTSTATILTPGGTTATTPQSDLEFVNALEPLVKIGADLIDKDNRGNTNIAWNPDGSSLAAASIGNNITIWDATTGKLTRTIVTGHKERLAGLAWSPDGTILAARLIDEATWQGLVVLWNAASGKEINSFPEANGLVTGMTWSPDGQTLAWTDGWSIRLWDATSSNLLPKPQPTWPAPVTGSSIGQSMVTNLAWSPDGKSLATSQGNIVKLWDPATGKEQMAFEAPQDTGNVVAISWSPDGHTLANLAVIENSSKARIQTWDVTTGQALKNFGNHGLGLHIRWSPNRSILAYSILVGKAEDGSHPAFTLHSSVTGEVLRTVEDLATDLAWSPDGRILATTNGLAGTITLWGVPGGPRPIVTVDIATPTARVTTTPRPTSGPPGTLGCGWSTVTLPSTGSVDSALSAIAAISATDIWAVGYVTDADYSQRNLIEHWDGTRWSIVPGPNQEGRHMRQYLSGLAAVASDDVWAVGGYSGGQKSPLNTAILHWDGRSWTSVPAPTPGKSNGLIRVAAVSKNDIWAVGAFSEVADQGVYVDQPLVEHWDGKQWSVVQTPDVGRGWLAGIAVVSPSDVWAVGNEGSGGSGRALTMHWDGATWKDVPPPIGAGGLNGAVAVAADDIWAVGQGEVLHWDGSQWSIVPPINNPNGEGSFLNSVTATSKSDLWAVGQLVARWSSKYNWLDRGWWDTQVNPNNDAASSARDARISLSGVAALSPNDVWVVGYRNDDHLQQLIMHYDGSLCVDLSGIPTIFPTIAPTAMPSYTPTAIPTQDCKPGWTVVDSPNPSEGRNGANEFSAVTAISANDVWAVGNTSNGTSGNGTSTMHWDGSQWKVVPNPGAGSPRAIAAIASDDVWVVGGSSTMHWNGTEWSSIVMATPGDSNGVELNGVAAVAANDVWAVGSHQRSTAGDLTLIEHWDGTKWSVVPSPNVEPNAGPTINRLSAIAAVSANDIWAVGYSYNGGQTLTLHWDGAQWSVVPSPSLPDQNYLGAVAAVSSNDVWAVGSHGTLQAPELLIMHWDGIKWAIASTPDVGPAPGLSGVAAISSNNVWAVGSSYNMDNGESVTITVHWDGAQWSLVPSPNMPNTTRKLLNHLAGVTVLPSGDLWAVGGGVSEAGGQASLVLRYRNAPCPTPIGP
jgi:WD40 repeat protein